jgi:hypothetical protein
MLEQVRKQVTYDNPKVAKCHLRFHGANSRPMKAIGLPVYEGDVTEEMISPPFFEVFMTDVTSSLGSTVKSLPSILQTVVAWMSFRQYNIVCFFVSTLPVF